MTRKIGKCKWFNFLNFRILNNLNLKSVLPFRYSTTCNPETMVVTTIRDEAHFAQELNLHGTKLVIVDFSASWCMPCVRIAPFFEEMSRKYPKAIFLKVDVDKCKETAAAQGVTAMPTFIFYRSRSKVDRLEGANSASLENMILKHYGSLDEEDAVYPAGMTNVSHMIVQKSCEALNDSDRHSFAAFLADPVNNHLESDCDEQLILFYTFQSPLRLHSLKICGPSDAGPKRVKLFVNMPHPLDFDAATRSVPVQMLELTEEDLKGTPVNLQFVKFQNVQTVQLFVVDNQTGEEVTRIDKIAFVGAMMAAVNMGDFKRIAGKSGEAH